MDGGSSRKIRLTNAGAQAGFPYIACKKATKAVA